MDIRIVKGETKYLDDCYEALINSEIGEVYFKSFDSKSMLAAGINAGEINVAIDGNDRAIGFLWCEISGTFGRHAFLHIIAIKEEYRGMNIGTQLINNFEAEMFKKDDKVFLMVAEFNNNAKKLYEKLGYVQVGFLPSFYRTNVNECLMMKIRGK